MLRLLAWVGEFGWPLEVSAYLLRPPQSQTGESRSGLLKGKRGKCSATQLLI